MKRSESEQVRLGYTGGNTGVWTSLINLLNLVINRMAVRSEFITYSIL